jgi:hypothetical protein
MRERERIRERRGEFKFMYTILTSFTVLNLVVGLSNRTTIKV